MSNILNKFAEHTDFAAKQAIYTATHPTVSIVNGKEAYFMSVKEPPRRAFFMPLIFERSHDLAYFPMHNYVDIMESRDGKVESTHRSYMCRGYVGKDCPICANGLKATKRAFFKAAVCIGEDGDVKIYKDADGAYRIEFVEMNKKQSTQLCTKAEKDDRGFIGTIFDLSATGEGRDTEYDLDVKTTLPKKEMDGEKVPDIDYEALALGLDKYPTLSDFVEQMTSDELYATYVPVPTK